MGTQADSAQVEFEAQLKALRRNFVDGLPARRGALSAAWGGCLDDGAEGSWQALRDAAHKLAGAASNYGFEAVGVSARALDRLLSVRPPCRDRARAQGAVARLLAELDAAMAGA